MKDINIKCYNLKEFKFAEQYLNNNGYKIHNNSDIIFYPIIFHNLYGYTKKYAWDIEELFNHFNYDNRYKITEAKHLMRQEKLNRINDATNR